MITANDLHALATWMIEQHGPRALHLADQAIAELELKAETYSANAWRALASVVDDLLEGRLEETRRPMVH